MILASLLLIAWCGYELSVRWDDWSAWTSGVRHLSRVHGESYLENLWIMMQDSKMRAMMWHMLLLVSGVLLGIFAILFRNRKGACIFVLIGCASLAAGLFLTGLRNWSGVIPGYAKPMLLLLLAAGAGYKLVMFCGSGRGKTSYRRKRHGNF